MRLTTRRPTGGCGVKPAAYTGLDLVVAMVTFVILAAVLWPLTMSRPRRTGARITCTCQLKQVSIAFLTWANDHNNQNPMQVSVTNGGTMEMVDRGGVSLHFEVLSNELATPKILACPADKRVLAATAFASGFGDRNVSYFVGVDATVTNPQMFLAGDRNLTNTTGTRRGFLNLTTNEPPEWTDEMHNRQGNVGLADGSVQQFTINRLRQSVAWTGVEVNRLAMP